MVKVEPVKSVIPRVLLALTVLITAHHALKGCTYFKEDVGGTVLLNTSKIASQRHVVSVHRSVVTVSTQHTARHAEQVITSTKTCAITSALKPLTLKA